MLQLIMFIKPSFAHECLTAFGELARADLSFEMGAFTVLIQVRVFSAPCSTVVVFWIRRLDR